jgi:hypothetical protein
MAFGPKHPIHGQEAAPSIQFGLHPNLSWSYDVSLQIDDRKVSPLERRLAITYAVSTSAMLCTACVAIASISGGLFAQAAPSINAGVKHVELVDNYIVVRPKLATPPKSALMQAFVVAPAAAPAPVPTDPPTTLAAPLAVAPPPAPAPAPRQVAAPAPAPAPTMAPRPVSTVQPAARPTHQRTQPPTTDAPPSTYQPHVHQHTGTTVPSGGGGGGGGDD